MENVKVKCKKMFFELKTFQVVNTGKKNTLQFKMTFYWFANC